MVQLNFFGEVLKVQQWSRVYQAGDQLRAQFGAHTIFLGTGVLAHRFAQQRGERGDALARIRNLFKGETQRMRLGILMFMRQVQ